MKSFVVFLALIAYALASSSVSLSGGSASQTGYVGSGVNILYTAGSASGNIALLQSGNKYVGFSASCSGTVSGSFNVTVTSNCNMSPSYVPGALAYVKQGSSSTSLLLNAMDTPASGVFYTTSVSNASLTENVNVVSQLANDDGVTPSTCVSSVSSVSLALTLSC